MVRSNVNEWTLLRDSFAARQDDQETIEAFLDDAMRRRFGEFISAAVMPEYKGRAVLPEHRHRGKG